MWEEMSYNKYNYNMLDRFDKETEFDVEFENIYKKDEDEININWEE